MHGRVLAATILERGDIAGSSLTWRVPELKKSLGNLIFGLLAVFATLRGSRRMHSPRSAGASRLNGDTWSISMSFNPLAPVTNYQSMLNRVFWFTSASALAAVWLLRLYIPELHGLLKQIDFTLAFGGDKIVPIPGGYLVPALAVGILTRIYRLHARISDWLAIRECFDIEVIIRELAAQTAVDLTPIADEELAKHRHSIMRKAFYPFVSGPQAQVDAQLVQQALDAWSWFWIGIEATFVFTLAGLALIAMGVYAPGFQTTGGTLILAIIGLPAMRGQCRRYAIAQVRAIVAEPARAAVVRSAFDELNGDRFTVRRAA
jgi:hypothetical protein